MLVRNLTLVLIFVMPLLSSVFVKDTGFSASPEWLKSVWGVSGVSVLIAIFIVSQYKNNTITFKKTQTLYPILLFVSWTIISLLWVIDEYLATIALAKTISFALIFIIVINVFKSLEDLSLVFKYLILSMFLVSAIGLIQYYYYDDTFIQSIFTSTALPGSTFGNKNMASHFLVMTLPLSLISVFFAKNNKNIIIYSVLTLVGAWFLIYTSARQAYLAIFIETIILFLVVFIDLYKNKDRSLLKTMDLKLRKYSSLAIITSLLIIASNYTNQGWSLDSGSKLDIVNKITVNGGASRIPAWMNTIEMIKDNSISGVGVGQWQNEYPQYYDRKLKDVIFNEKTRLKRLHNEYLEMYANVGLVGYIFLIWLVYFVIRRTLGVLMNFENVYRLHVVGLALGLVGFSVVAMFSFPIGVYLPAFLAMTYIGLIEVASLNSNGNTIHLKNNKRLVSILSVILIIFAFYSSKKSFEWLVSDAFRNNASIFIKGNRFQEAEYSSMKSIEYNQWNKESYLLSGISKFNLGKVEESIPFFKMAIDIAPFDTLSLLNLSLVYNKTKNIKMESKVLEFILKIDSRNVPAAAKLATLLFKHGQKKDAQIIYLTLKKNFSYFLGRSGFGPYYNVAGPVAILFNDAKYAEYIYQEAIKDSPISDYYIKLASINYFFLDRKDKAIKYYRKALELDPDTLKNKEIKVLIQGYESITKH